MSKVAKAAIGLMVVTLLGKILGFGREIALATAYGTSSYSDAYLVAINIPNVLFTTIGAALSTTFIPIFYDINENQGEEISLQFTNNVLNIVVVICLVLIVVGLIFTEQIVKLFAMGFEGEVLNIAISFTRIVMPGIVFIGITKIFSAYLNINDNFIIPGLISIPYNIVIIVFIILSRTINPILLAYGTLIAMIFQCLFQIPPSYKYGYKYSNYLKLSDKNLQKVIILTGPVFIGVGVNQINVMIDRTLASTLVEGSISALNYANKLNGFIMGIFIVSIVSVIYPMFSRLSAEKDIEQFNNTVSKSIKIVTLIIVPIAIGAITLAKPIVKLLFERGAFDERATYMTSIALIFYSIGMIGFALREVLGKVFYSLKDTRTPMYNGVLAMIFNVILNIILVRYMGHGGLALATSISAILCIILLLISLKKRLNSLDLLSIIKIFIKSIIASIIMAIITIITYNCTISNTPTGDLYNVLVLIISIIIGAISYLLLIILFRVREVKDILTEIKYKIKN